MVQEFDLNQLINGEQNTVTQNETSETVMNETATPVVTETPAAETPVTPSVPAVVNMNDFLVTHHSLISNARVVNFGGMTGIPAGKYMMFKTNEEEDASIYMFESANTIWVPNNTPLSIRVESSGVIINYSDKRVYIGKSNVTVFDIVDGKIVRGLVISKADTAETIKINQLEVTVDASVDMNYLKLQVKSITPRLYNAIKDMTTKAEIRTEINVFSDKVKDINHLIKLDKDLILAFNL